MPVLVPDDGTGHEALVVIGEAPASHEVVQGRPFVGPSGYRIREWMDAVGLARHDAYWTNVYPFQAPGNKIKAVPHADLAPWVDDLHARIAKLRHPVVLVPTGDTALRALLTRRGLTITKARGSIYSYTDRNGRSIKVIPTIHPAATFHTPSWERRCRLDWHRIAGDLAFPELRLPVREHFIKPTLSDLKWYVGDATERAALLAVDIETPRRLVLETVPGRAKRDGTLGKSRTKRSLGAPRITCVGYSFDPVFSMTIPTTESYWGDDLPAAWDAIRTLNALACFKTAQNHLFDAYWLSLAPALAPLAAMRWDTRWMHHALDPLDAHSLAYMASIDTREPYWKDDAKDGGDLDSEWSDLETFWRYCLDADTAVLTDDFTWKRLEDVVVGDKLLAVDENGGAQRNGKMARRWRITTVTETYMFERPCYEVTTESGGVLVATGDHEVLTNGPSTKRWLRVDHLRADTLKSTLLRPFKMWTDEPEIDQAWFGGLLDGEGTISGTKDGKGKAGGKYGFGYLAFSQKPGIVWERAVTTAKADGFSLSIHKNRDTYRGYLQGGVKSAMQALGTYRPIRLIENMKAVIARGHVRATDLGPDRIVNIRPVGMRKVVDIKTTTHTFIANGFVVHNCGKDAAVTVELASLYMERLQAEGRMAFYERHYRRLFTPLLRMMLRGLRLDTAARGRTAARLTADRLTLEARLTAVAQTSLYGKAGGLSNKRLATYLYETLKLPKQKDRKTKAVTTKEVVVRKLMLMKPATLGSVNEAQALAEADKAAAFSDAVAACAHAGPLILTYRRKAKLSDFVKEGLADDDGYVRTQYGFTETLRLTSGRNPRRTGANLQNVDRALRHVYVPEPGMFFLEVDASQGEDRIVKCLTGAPHLIARATLPPWENDEHRRAAQVIWPDLPITPERRYLGKRARHAGNYGLMGLKLSEELLKDGVVVDPSEAQGYIDTLLDKDTPEVRTWQQRVRSQVMRDRTIANSWGQVWDFQWDRLNDDLYRFAYASVPQSELVNLVNHYGLVPLDKWLRASAMRTILHHQNHDSLLMSTILDEAYDVAVFLDEHISRPRTYAGVKLSMPVEVKLGLSWKLPLELKRLPAREEFNDRVRAMLAGGGK